jgi:hypothetical protein
MRAQGTPSTRRTTAALIEQADKELAKRRHLRAIASAEQRIKAAPSIGARVDAQFAFMRAVGGDAA